MIGNHAHISWLGLVQSFCSLPNLAHSRNHLRASVAAFALAQCWSTWRYPLASHPHLHKLKAEINTLAKWVRESLTRDSGRKGPYSARGCLCEQLTSAASIHQTMEVFPCSKTKRKETTNDHSRKAITLPLSQFSMWETLCCTFQKKETKLW